MLLENLLPRPPDEPLVPAPRLPTLGAMLHQPEAGPSLVQRLNELRRQKNAPPPEPARPAYWRELQEQRQQDADDRAEFLVHLRAKRLNTTNPEQIDRLSKAERQLIEMEKHHD
jgi:hypothetical protein